MDHLLERISFEIERYTNGVVDLQQGEDAELEERNRSEGMIDLRRKSSRHHGRPTLGCSLPH